MADGLCYYTLSGLLWINEKSNLLCLHEVRREIDCLQFILTFFLILKRKTSADIEDDNCCNCNVAGTRFASRIHNDDVIFASYKNQVYEVRANEPFVFLFPFISFHKFNPWNFEFSGDSGISRIFSSILFLRLFLFVRILEVNFFLVSRLSLEISFSVSSLKSVGNGGFALNFSNSDSGSYGRFSMLGAKKKL